MHNKLGEKLLSYLAREQLPPGYAVLVQQWLVPLADWLASRQAAVEHAPLLVGFHGAQGSGKTTLCGVLEHLLEESGLQCLTLSLDDFYLTRSQRLALADEVHPLLRTRGVPGTHDMSLLAAVLDALAAGQPCRLPVFNKATDDRKPEHEWRQWVGRADIVLLEGWCVGSKAEPQADLLLPVNSLEASEDGAGVWRRYVNDCLAGEYASLFQRLDLLVMLKAPSMQQVRQWRQLQEQRLAQREQGSGLMSAEQLERFIQHYERTTLAALAEMPGRADYLLELNADHGIQAASLG
jgi:D-glycerate 3-kinase